jgi:hypothetical protein
VNKTTQKTQNRTKPNPTRLDDDYVDYHEDTKDTSLRRVPTFIPAVDVPRHVHNASDDSHNVAHRRSMRFDAHCVDYIEDTEDTSVRRVPPSNHSVHTAGRRTMTSTAHLPTVDVSKHVHNLPNTLYNPTRRKSTRFDDDCIDYQGDVKDTSYGRVPPFLPTVNVSGDSHNPTRRHSTRLDAYCVDLIESTEDTSVRRASPNLPTTDAPDRVFHPPTSLSELKDRRPTRFNVSSDIDHQENDEDTSSRRVPSSFLPLAAGRCITTSATCPLAVDVSRRVRNPSVDAYEPTRQRTMCYVASSGIDYPRDHAELEETSIRCSSSSPQSPRTYGRRITTSVASRSTEDMSKHVHQPSVGFYEPTREDMTHYYASSSIPCQRNDEVDEDMSHRRVSSSYLPPPTSGRRITTSTTVMSALDVSKHTHYLSPRLYESTDQRSRCLDVSPDGDHREDTQDMSLQHVPSSYLCPPTYGRRNTTSVTSMSAADTSNCVHHPSIGSYEPLCQRTTHYDASLGIDRHREDDETSSRCDASSHQPPCNYGRRIMTSVTSTSAEDVSRHVNSLPDGSYGLTHPRPRHLNVPLDVDRHDMSIRCVSLTSDTHKLDVQDDWEERIVLICMKYGLTKPHCQAQYRERAIKIVDEFAGNEPEKMVKGCSKYYNTILKMFTRLAIKYRQNRNSK